MEEKIRSYISYLLSNDAINAYDYASQIFGDAPLQNTHADLKLIIPELVQFMPVKRKLVQDIIMLKTGYKTGMAKDDFMEGTIILVDKAGTSNS